MPVGLVIMKWDERVGTQVVAQYPEEVNLTAKTLMQVYSTHEYTGEPGMVSLMVGSLNVASYYTGPETGYYIILLLTLEDDPDLYEGGLSDISRQIVATVEEETLTNLMPSIFQRLSVYPKLNEEQQLAIVYEDEIKRLILNRLREEGVITKSELMVWLKDKYKRGFVDLDAIVISLIKNDLIKEASVKGMPSELVFLTHDILMTRVPPTKLLADPSVKGLPVQQANDYIIESKKFFQEYKPNESDNLALIEVILDPQVYETLRLLRTAIVTRNDLEKLKKKGVEDVDYVLKKLWEVKMIQVIQDEKGNEYYALLTDFFIQTFFPQYLLNIIKEQYATKAKSNQVLVEYLNVLEDAFLERKEKKEKATELETEIVS